MWQIPSLLKAIANLLQLTLTEVKGLRADMQRTKSMTTTLQDALADEHLAVQLLITNDATKQATIDSLNQQAKAKDAELAAAKANAATPEQIALIQADALALRTAAQAVAQQPVQTPPDTTPPVQTPPDTTSPPDTTTPPDTSTPPVQTDPTTDPPVS